MNYLFFDCPITDGIEHPTLETLDAALRKVGGNTGNILFRLGIVSSLLDELTPCHWSDGQTLASDQTFDGVILGTANWLSTYHDNGNHKRAKILRELNKPAICIGLVVQHSLRTSKMLDFPSRSLDLLNSLRELEATVLVRDEFTYDQCAHYGIANLAVIGCPSNFIDTSQKHDNTLLSKSETTNPLRRVTLNHGHSRQDILLHDTAILRSVRQTDGLYVVQDNLNGEIEAALSAKCATDLPPRNRLRSLPLAFFTGRSIHNNIMRNRHNLRVYFHALEWLEALKTLSIVLGSRIHGSIAALQAGIPAAITTIDSRTEGLAEALGIPRVNISKLKTFPRKFKAETILEASGLDFTPYLRRRSQLLSTYKKHMTDFGLTLTPRLARIDKM